MTPRVWVERPIESVEDAEALPEGTVAISVRADGTVADVAVRTADPITPWEAGAEVGRSYSDAQMVGDLALVPVEAEDEHGLELNTSPDTPEGNARIMPVGSRERAEWERDEARTAIERVREVHAPIDALHVAGRRQTLRKVCTGCGTDDGNWQVWPCPTIRAIERKP